MVAFNAYNVSNDGNNIITNIQPGITVSSFASPDKVSITSGAALSFSNKGTILDNSGAVGTGMAINLLVNGSVTDTYTSVIYGDVNGDGKIDLDDLINLRDNITGAYLINGVYKLAGDLYGEGDITLNDLVGLMAYVSKTGLINQAS